MAGRVEGGPRLDQVVEDKNEGQHQHVVMWASSPNKWGSVW